MTDYNAFKAAELKELLKERGIPSTGLTRKQQYIEALQEDDEKPAAQEDDDNAVAEEDGVEPTAPEGDAQTAAQDNEDTPIAQENDEAEAIPENNAEINGTPLQASQTPEDQSDNRKRKRRSPTPPVNEESVQKKLKAADGEEIPKLPEDLKEEAPAPVEGEAEQTVQPTSVSDDVMDVSGAQEVKQDDIEQSAENTEKQQDISTEPMAVDSTGPSDVETTGPPSTHPPTPALYIRNLLPTPPNEPIDDSLISTIHLDTFKSHAFVIFTSTSAAALARAGLHDRIWPEETQRKALWVDYVPVEKAQDWIETEQAAGKSKRFEKSPQHNNPNPTTTTTAPSTTPGPGMPNAPTGPRNTRPTATQPTHPRKPLHSPSTLAHFPATTAQPKLFYQPVPADLVGKRLDELDRETSRDWAGGRQKPFGGPLDQLRRYTFEDGDVVVDGGVDFGGFGRDRGAGGGGHGPGGGHGGGRRRGGGGRRR
ncbi:hypothetical protein Q7P37_007793 [Cladosporium fusiforme]